MQTVKGTLSSHYPLSFLWHSSDSDQFFWTSMTLAPCLAPNHKPQTYVAYNPYFMHLNKIERVKHYN